jgi:hypothetical protein
VPLLQIEEVPVSDLGPKTVNPEDVFRWIPWFLQENSETGTHNDRVF